MAVLKGIPVPQYRVHKGDHREGVKRGLRSGHHKVTFLLSGNEGVQRGGCLDDRFITLR